MHAKQFKEHCLPSAGNNILVTAVREGRLVGHCFVSQWMRSGDRVWWITQLIVVRHHRDQRVATQIRAFFLSFLSYPSVMSLTKVQMLKIIANLIHRLKEPKHKDFVGVLSPNPLTVCAILRVFGRGIEAIPSRADWERNPTAYPHEPLQSHEARWLMGVSCPVDHVFRAISDLVTLTARTNLYVDHTESHKALERINHSMNKQVREPWEWLFGSLADGHEYLCVMDYRPDPTYAMRPQLCNRTQASPPPTRIPTATLDPPPPALTPRKYARYRPLRPHPLPPVDFTQLNDLLTQHPETLHSTAQTAHLTTSTHISAPLLQRLAAANSLLSQRPSLVPTMDAKPFPLALRTAYLPPASPLSDLATTWLDLKHFTDRDVPRGEVAPVERLVVMQAVHFLELVSEFEGVRVAEEKAWARSEEERVSEEMIRVEKERRESVRSSLRLSTQSAVSVLSSAADDGDVEGAGGVEDAAAALVGGSKERDPGCEDGAAGRGVDVLRVLKR
jgi:hypothetical protein